MKLFECQNCRQPVYFENTRCESCGMQLGYLPSRDVVTALQPSDGGWRALADKKGKYQFCANLKHNVCNWLIRFDRPDQYCAACRHNRTIPDLSQPLNLARWRKLEIAKHRLFYTLLKLRLPLATRAEDPNGGLAFDFIARQEGRAGTRRSSPAISTASSRSIWPKRTIRNASGNAPRWESRIARSSAISATRSHTIIGAG